MLSVYSQRKQFNTNLLREVTALVRRTSWKKSSYVLFACTKTHFESVSISVRMNTERTTATKSFKPMSLDPILWDILGMPENLNKPLSLRALGAFTCQSLPISEWELEQPGQQPEEVARTLLNFLSSSSTGCPAASSESFSSMIQKEPNQVERGAYAITLVTSLISEGNTTLAREFAERYLSGDLRSVSKMTSQGSDFHELALRWLDSGSHVRPPLNAA